jgi:hypothetical protein
VPRKTVLCPYEALFSRHVAFACVSITMVTVRESGRHIDPCTIRRDRMCPDFVEMVARTRESSPPPHSRIISFSLPFLCSYL